ncbi:hypothetical protein VTN77DRAFT_7827 [Rasamsonia byssochlamydoides]|uniref:uncharacterized protein n=1 Tax=Rasamsonia byssochlamydoides TaxID=89139 RepID=UPI0037444467
MAQIPTPPLSPQASEGRLHIEDQEEKASQDQILLLDSLLERYLNLLDRHQTLQKEIGKQLSSGFFSLAHANYCSPPGRRYGEDYYDQRMKATRRLLLKTPSLPPDQKTESGQSHSTSLIYQVQYTSVIPHEEESEDEKDHRGKTEQSGTNISSTSEQEEEDTASGTDSPETSDIPTPPTPSEPTEEEQETQPESPEPPRKPFRSDDPLSWYGILVPPSLKNAQRSFTEAIDGNIPELATVISEMRQVEQRVYSLRKEIGLS